MNAYPLMYLVYLAKLLCQGYLTWFTPTSKIITAVAAAVPILATVPFTHVILHVCYGKPLSFIIIIAYFGVR